MPFHIQTLLILLLLLLLLHPFNGPFPGLPRWAGTRKVKPIWILLKQETVSGSGISWTICKSAPLSRQITSPVPHHSVFLQARWPSCHPTNSVKALKAIYKHTKINSFLAYRSAKQIVVCVYCGLRRSLNSWCLDNFSCYAVITIFSSVTARVISHRVHSVTEFCSVQFHCLVRLTTT